MYVLAIDVAVIYFVLVLWLSGVYLTCKLQKGQLE